MCCFKINQDYWTIFGKSGLSETAYHNGKLLCENLTHLQTCNKITIYRGSPTYTKITNTVSTSTFFGLCTCKWGKLALVGDHSTVPLTRVSCNTVFSKSQKTRKAGTLCTLLPKLISNLATDYIQKRRAWPLFFRI